MDLAILIAFTVSLNLALLAVTERYAGPITVASTVALITALLRRRRIQWSSLGLRRPSRPMRLFAQVPVVLVVWVAASFGAATLVGRYLPLPDMSPRFGDLAGNLPATAKWIAVGWLTGAFGEEMIFRGFVLNRLEALLPRGAGGSVAAVLLQGFLFGAVHAYDRGLYGLLVLGAVGVVGGIFYLVFGRTLWPTILAHGLVNTLGFLARYHGLK